MMKKKYPDIRPRNKNDSGASIAIKFSSRQALRIATNLVEDRDVSKLLGSIGPSREAYVRRASTFHQQGKSGRPRNFSHKTALLLLIYVFLTTEWDTWKAAADHINNSLTSYELLEAGVRKNRNGKPVLITKDSFGRACRDIATAFGRDHESDRTNLITGELTQMPQRGDLNDLLTPLLLKTVEVAGFDCSSLTVALDSTRIDSHTTLIGSKRYLTKIAIDDPDSRAGHRTVTPRHPEEITLGAEFHIASTAPKLGEPTVPILAVGADIAADPAGAFKKGGIFEQYPGGRGDYVLKQLRCHNVRVTEVLADRGYTESPSFLLGAYRQGIQVIRDLKKSSARNYKIVPGSDALYKAGGLYAPCTPRKLLDARHPDELENAPASEQQKNLQLWKELRLWRFEPNGRPYSTKDGRIRQRFRGPAQAGRVKRMNSRSPKEENFKNHGLCFEDHNDSQGCCANITVSEETLAALSPHPFGSNEHKASYNRRSYIENLNGALQSKYKPQNLKLKTMGRKRLFWMCKLIAYNVHTTRTYHLVRQRQDPWCAIDQSLRVDFSAWKNPPHFVSEAEEPLHRQVFAQIPLHLKSLV